MNRLTVWNDNFGHADILEQKDCSRAFSAQMVIDKLCDYETDEEFGRMIRTPVSIGDTVWIIELGYGHENHHIIETVVTSIVQDKSGISINCGDSNMFTKSYSVDSTYFGRYLFSSKKAAEYKLQELIKQDNDATELLASLNSSYSYSDDDEHNWQVVTDKTEHNEG